MALAGILCLQAHLAFSQSKWNMGGDISMLPQYESAGTVYMNSAGGKVVPLTYMKNTAKMNSMRVRLFVNPATDDATVQSGVVQDLKYVAALGKRIKDLGLDFLLDFHYSDSWADPSYQTVPKAWYKGTLSASNPTNAALGDTLYNYTRRSLEYLVANGAKPDFVQIGNEISYGMLWRTNNDRCFANSTNGTWLRFTNLLKQASKAVRETVPEAKIVIHIERTKKASDCTAFYNRMRSAGVDYDIIGLSYYPFWHGYISDLSNTLNALEKQFPDKSVQIVETAYYYNWFPTGDVTYTNTTDTWAGTARGQKAFIEDLCTELAEHDNVTGLYYWFPEENGSGQNKTVLAHWLNRGLWDNSTHKANPGALSLKNFLTLKAEKEAAKVVTIDDITTLIGVYLTSGSDGKVTIDDITALIDKYLKQSI